MENRLALSDWAVVVRFDDGSIATLLSLAGPPELCAPDEGDARERSGKLRNRVGAALAGLTGARHARATGA